MAAEVHARARQGYFHGVGGLNPLRREHSRKWKLEAAAKHDTSHASRDGKDSWMQPRPTEQKRWWE